MISALQFKKGDKLIVFNHSDSIVDVKSLPVPRINEEVSVRKTDPDGDDESMTGWVKMVEWYFSNSNRGPVVGITLEDYDD